jgi:hypothetical protein
METVASDKMANTAITETDLRVIISQPIPISVYHIPRQINKIGSVP